MIPLLLAASLTLQAQVQAPTPAPADAYADSATAELVRHARAARERNERLVTAYTATASQRIGVGIRALSRDRMLYRQELVARIFWRRDSVSRIEAVGAREGIPIAQRGDQLPESLRSDLSDLVLDPASDYLKVTGLDQNDDGFVYPLSAGAEALYRFAIGGTTVIGLPGGKQVRLVALRVTPRRADWKLMAGTLWFDADTYGLVRAAFRPARPYELRRDLAPEDQEDIPGWVNASAEVRYVTLEYGLYENRWWMPRYVAIDAVGTMGSWLNMPVRVERTYTDYTVEGGAPPDPNSTFRPAGRPRYLARDGSVIDSTTRRERADARRAMVTACRDSVRTGAGADTSGAEYRAARRSCRRESGDTALTVVVPADTAALLTSAALGPPILQMGDLISEDEILALRPAIEGLPDRPWESRVELPSGVSALLRHARYNRIEALSLGLGAGVDFGKFQLDGLARIGLADGEPNGEVSLVRQGIDRRLAITGYRRLAAANPDTRPFGAVNSVMALMAGRDDGQYFRSHGLEVTLGSRAPGGWSVRAWHEWQRPVGVETNASLPHLFSGSQVFRPNITADRATQTGLAVRVGGAKPLSRSTTLGWASTVDGATGDYDFARGAVTLRAIVTPGGPLAGAITLAAGTSTGEVPVQSRFYLGGAATLRGYAGGVASGTAFWRARAEIGNTFPAARLVGFTDLGWAGDRHDFGAGTTLLDVGIGGSFLDGLVRIDLARALRGPRGTRLEFYFDGML